MAVRHYRALLEPAGDGGWGVIFPEPPGCVSHGRDPDHAKRMAAEALALHLSAMADDGEPMPDPASAGRTAAGLARRQRRRRRAPHPGAGRAARQGGSGMTTVAVHLAARPRRLPLVLDPAALTAS
jgi:predicted RNase H-like HicB family nuclease